MVMRASSDEVATGSFKVHSFLRSELGTPKPLHISLSRPIGLLTHQRHSFKETFANGVAMSKIRSYVHNETWARSRAEVPNEIFLDSKSHRKALIGSLTRRRSVGSWFCESPSLPTKS